jgi:tetratricopeptide (TPR) repeat protein
VSAARSRGVTLREKKSENGGSGGGGAVDASDAGTGGAGTGGAVNPTGPTEGAGEGEEPIVEDDPFALVEGPETGGKKTGKKGSKDAKLGSNKRDPAHARELADKGMTALNSGRRSEAQSLFEQAISYDNRNAKALMGLSTIYFDTGADQKAVLFAERAVQAAPGTASYRLSLGDAYYKVLRYRDALEQYEKAKDLGSNRADDRIAKVKPKVGG